MPKYLPKAIAKIAEKAVINGFMKAVEETNSNRKITLALFEAGIVESNLRNVNYGDRDSVGALQQRAGWGSKQERMDPYLAAMKFIKEAKRVQHRYKMSGQLAQGVQRSAYPLRYQLAYPAASYIIKRASKE